MCYAELYGVLVCKSIAAGSRLDAMLQLNACMYHNSVASQCFYGVIAGRCWWQGHSSPLYYDCWFVYNVLGHLHSIDFWNVRFSCLHFWNSVSIYILVYILLFKYLGDYLCAICNVVCLLFMYSSFSRIVDVITRKAHHKRNGKAFEKVIVWIIKGIFQRCINSTELYVFFSTRFRIWPGTT